MINPLLAGRLLIAFVIAAALAWGCHLIYKAGGDARVAPHGRARGADGVEGRRRRGG